MGSASAIREGALGIGILCEVVDPNASPRKIKAFDDSRLLLLGTLSEFDNHIYAPILKSFPIDELPALINNRAGRHNSVINDIPAGPIGFQVPGRKQVSGYQYQRDEKVRRHIIMQARGVCEYCGETGFLLPDGRHYLEAHHIIALAKQGPDTVDNVIALCPTDHREAHYGAKAVAMEEKMLQIIKHR
jgi:5-methylcytosine-specific restriction protein A